MIGRLWSGRTRTAGAHDYEQFLRCDLLPQVARLDGSRGAYVMRREVPGAVEFVTLTLFDSLDAMRSNKPTAIPRRHPDAPLPHSPALA